MFKILPNNEYLKQACALPHSAFPTVKSEVPQPPQSGR